MCHPPAMVYVFQLSFLYIAGASMVKTPTSSLLCPLTFRCILGTTRLLSAAYRVTGRRMQDSRRHNLENCDNSSVNTVVQWLTLLHQSTKVLSSTPSFGLSLCCLHGFSLGTPKPPPIRIRGRTEKKPCVIPC